MCCPNTSIEKPLNVLFEYCSNTSIEQPLNFGFANWFSRVNIVSIM
jgi:hypothetical protein